MRILLKEHLGKQITLTATFNYVSVKKHNLEDKTVLLTDIKLNDKVISDHAWITPKKNLLRRFDKLNKNTIINFTSIIKQYIKVNKNKQIEEDYRLSHIRNLSF